MEGLYDIRELDEHQLNEGFRKTLFSFNNYDDINNVKIKSVNTFFAISAFSLLIFFSIFYVLFLPSTYDTRIF